jgi:hypothetical protein
LRGRIKNFRIFAARIKIKEIMVETQVVKQKYNIISQRNDDVVQLSFEQAKMLLMSESDIQNGRLVSENDLNKADEQWLF